MNFLVALINTQVLLTHINVYAVQSIEKAKVKTKAALYQKEIE